jgi:hypothetical protein
MMSVSEHAIADASAGSAVHPWLRRLNIAFLPGERTDVQAQVIAGLSAAFPRFGHTVQVAPDDNTDVLFACARFGEPVAWREAPMLQARRVFRLRRQPTVVTILHAPRQPWEQLIAQLDRAVAKEPPDPADFDYPGLAPSAYRTLVEQGRRGGPVLAAQRLFQAQTLCVRILVAVGDDRPDVAYHFDLVGSLARTEGGPGFYDDIALRMATAASAEEIGAYSVLPGTVPADVWAELTVPAAMRQASLELGRRNFFTQTVRVGELVHVPALDGAVANQYSEGCFATWEPRLDALIATITGSARPVDKGNVTDDELAVITGLREDRAGVYVRQVEGKRNDPPSSEAFEMVDIDNSLPRLELGPEWGVASAVPVARSKLHGHRGVASFNPDTVEFAPMNAAYSRYPVTCGTRGQAEGVREAFVRAGSLRDPDDPRQIIFTLLPTHGVFILEKWVPGKAPFQAIWEAMDAGDLEIESQAPQGPELYTPRVRRR